MVIAINIDDIVATTIIMKIGQACHLVKCSTSRSIHKAIINHVAARVVHTILMVLPAENRLGKLLMLRILVSSCLDAGQTRTICLFRWGSATCVIL